MPKIILSSLSLKNLSSLSPVKGFFFISSLKNLQIQDTHCTTYKILYDTTNTIPRGARYHVYPVALIKGIENISARSTLKSFGVFPEPFSRSSFSRSSFSRSSFSRSSFSRSSFSRS